MEQMGEQLTAQRACDKCKEPCCFGDFKQVAELKNSGLLIYVPKDAEYAEQHAQRKKKDFFILHNASDRKLIRPDYVKEMCQYRTKCLQCREFIHRVRNLIDEISDIKQNEVIGVCQYCKRLNPGNCKRCEYFVNKFKCCQAAQKQEKHEHFISWLHKVDVLIQSILECKNVCTTRLYDEPSQYLIDLLKLMQELKPLSDVGLPNILTNVMNSGNDAKTNDMLQDLLLKMKQDTSSLPRMLNPAYNKVSPCMEYCRLTFMDSLTKNRGKLEDILLKLKYDIDVRLLSKMLECACGAEDKLGRSFSIEYLAKLKKMFEELLLQMKYDRMKERSLENYIDKASSNEILPDVKIKISELIKPAKKENVFKKFIQVMSQKGMKKDESTLDKTLAKGKTLVPVMSQKGIKKDESTVDKTLAKDKTLAPLMSQKGIKKDESTVDKTLAKDKTLAPLMSQKGIKKDESTVDKTLAKDKTLAPLMSQKGIKKDESTVDKTLAKDKTLIPVYNKNKTTKNKLTEKQESRDRKPDLTKGRSGKRRDSVDTALDNVFDDTKYNKEQGLKRKRNKSTENKESDLKKSGSKDFLTGETIKVYDEKHESIDMNDLALNLGARKFRAQDPAKFTKKGKINGKINFMYSDSISELEPLTKVLKDAPIIIKGTKLVKLDAKKTIPEQVSKKEPLLYSQHKFKNLDETLPSIDNTLPCPLIITAVDDDQHEKENQRKRSLSLLTQDKTQERSGFLYQLSDRKFIRNGWTLLPKTKTLRKVRIYKMEPALPQYDWFENNKMKKLIFYDSGEKLAEIDDDGHGRWFYKNGEVALDFHNTEEGSYTGQRYVVYSRGDDVDMGKTSPRTVLASFDHRGNGVVYDRYGNERLKYNQFEGVVHDEKVGPTSRWKWHALNEPPDLYAVTVDNYVKQIDPGYKENMNKVSAEKTHRKPKNLVSKLEMQQCDGTCLAMEHENFIKLTPKFKPFKIRMKALKINENFSLRVLDQANIYVLFRDGPIMQKLNVGMNLINELIDIETIDTEDVETPYEQLPPLSQSLENIQKNVDKVRRLTKIRAEKNERLLMPPKLSRSAYKVGIGIKERGHCSVQSQMQYPTFQMSRQEKD